MELKIPISSSRGTNILDSIGKEGKSKTTYSNVGSLSNDFDTKL